MDGNIFQFVTASFLINIDRQRATTLDEFRSCLEQVPDASIFFHTFQSLGQHHFLTEGFSNDFAQWALAALNRAVLAEQLAGVDIRDYVSLPDLRSDLLRIVSDYCELHPDHVSVPSVEPFYFSEAVEVTVPLGVEARTLTEFREGLLVLGHSALQHHFIASRLRLHLKTNDFSQWLETSLGLAELARKINRIDIYTNTLDSARQEMLDLIDRELANGGHAA